MLTGTADDVAGDRNLNGEKALHRTIPTNLTKSNKCPDTVVAVFGHDGIAVGFHYCIE
jgi:hypothetical protein